MKRHKHIKDIALIIIILAILLIFGEAAIRMVSM